MNFDPMTGEPIKRNFDPMTGEPINQEQSVQTEQPQMSFDPMTGQPIGMEEKPKKKGFFKSRASKIVLAIAIVAVVVCGVGAFVFASGVFASKSDKVLNAIKNTIEDKGELTKTFEIGDIIKSNEYTMAFSMEADGTGIDFEYLSGKSGKQITGNIEAAYSDSIDFGVNFTDEELQVQIPFISDKVFTYNYKGENTGYLMDSLSSDETEAINKMLEYIYNAKSDNKATEEFYDAVLEEYKSLEFEEVKDAEYEVDGKDRTCKGYETVITKENFQNLIDAYEEATSEQINEMEELMSDLDSTYMVGSYEEMYDELRDALEEMPDVTVTFYLYDNKLACIELQPKGMESVQIQFLGGDTRAQNIRIVDEDGYVLMEIVGETDGSTVSYELLVDEMSVLSISYDSKSGDFSLFSDEFSMSGTIVSERNGFTITIDQYNDGYDDYEFEGSFSLKKGADFKKFEGDNFDIGNASEDEVMDLMMEISDSLY